MQSNFKESLIATRTYAFVLQIISMTKRLEKNYENIVIIRQIIRSAASIGANIEEALGSNSRKEFIHSMNIAKKEARETLYWLKLLLAINSSYKEDLNLLMQENNQIINILTKIVKTSNEKSIGNL